MRKYRGKQNFSVFHQSKKFVLSPLQQCKVEVLFIDSQKSDECRHVILISSFN